MVNNILNSIISPSPCVSDKGDCRNIYEYETRSGKTKYIQGGSRLKLKLFVDNDDNTPRFAEG